MNDFFNRYTLQIGEQKETVFLHRNDIQQDGTTSIYRDIDGKLLAEPEITNTMNMMFGANYNNVGAREMRKPIIATFFEGDTVISKTITWSVESYVAQTRAKADATQAEIDMVNAMLIYGDSVGAYLTASGQ